MLKCTQPLQVVPVPHSIVGAGVRINRCAD